MTSKSTSYISKITAKLQKHIVQIKRNYNSSFIHSFAQSVQRQQ